MVTPSPRFRIRSTPPDTHSSRENLLIEHPTMSVYTQRPSSATRSDHEDEIDNQETQDSTAGPQTTELVLRTQATRAEQTRRLQLATQLGIPMHVSKPPLQISQAKPPGRKIMHRQNQSHIRVVRGKKTYKIQHCGVKAGRRRC